MLKKIKYKNTAWVDLTNPSREEVSELTAEYDLPTLTEDELLHPSHRAKIDWTNDHLYLVLHFPLSENSLTEIDFLIGRDFLITVHYQAVPALMEFAQILDGGDHGKRKKEENFHAGHLFYYMIRELYNPLEENLESLQRKLRQIGDQIAAANETETVRGLAVINRQILDIRRSIEPQKEIFRLLGEVGLKLYGAQFSPYARALFAEQTHLSGLIKNNCEIFAELGQTNQSLLLIKTGRRLQLLIFLTAGCLAAIILSLIV
ncbi:MAG: hypothetical protein COV08_02945 [Candidatus Vogelbacteria bacterium CG10_big_fil_rev_8_21_14_0_10_49_38]|uniref:Magnesium transporter CorA n=1 Tax=Candidatus Vogelbacteria bacterium CG10_big_fil_rev_8_21_14_0_10_49_38 TaxID=1975043 RepID=A0A2H0RH56_9BACT|nr:MAG: hypothetical protein BK006_02955 [bacterium CG10_49_38]PIR45828.1 MAG: hypothetical protein COV08_02945 [Candidatus Vogelbacteria bacterium CG10_big_fil_rev_8_21_14_0_10_49_38]